MTLKILSIATILFLLHSCSNKSAKTMVERKLKGSIEQRLFTNDYLKMRIMDGWTEFPSNDETQFLIIQKATQNFKPNMIFLALDKKKYKELYGYQDVAQYAQDLAAHNQSKAEYKLLTPLEKVSIDKHEFYLSKFLLTKNEKEYQQSFYTTDLGNYYLGIVVTENNQELEPEVEKIIKSIKFK